jgi:hypothetical protein
MKIKPPNWTTGGCLAERHFKTPDGWLGVRHDSTIWTVTGCDNKGWRDFGVFKTEQEAEDFAIKVYHEQINAFLSKFLIDCEVV